MGMKWGIESQAPRPASKQKAPLSGAFSVAGAGCRRSPATHLKIRERVDLQVFLARQYTATSRQVVCEADLVILA